MKASLLHEWRHRATGARVTLLSWGRYSEHYLDGYLLQANRPTILGEDCWETLLETKDPGSASSRGQTPHLLELLDGRGVAVTNRAPATGGDVRLRAMFLHGKVEYRLIRMIGESGDSAMFIRGKVEDRLIRMSGDSRAVARHVVYHLQRDERDERDLPRWRTTLVAQAPEGDGLFNPNDGSLFVSVEFLACSLLDGVDWEIVEHRASSQDGDLQLDGSRWRSR